MRERQFLAADVLEHTWNPSDDNAVYIESRAIRSAAVQSTASRPVVGVEPGLLRAEAYPADGVALALADQSAMLKAQSTMDARSI